MIPYNFGGDRIVIPGTYTEAKFPAQPTGVSAAGRIAAIVAPSQGGIPYNANVSEALRKNTTESIAQARGILIGGTAYHMAEFYLNPTNDLTLNTPSQVYVIRVDPSTQATSVIQNTGATTDIIDLASGRYGTSANYVQYKIEAGSSIGYKVSVSVFGNLILDAQDDVSYEYFSIEYIGIGTAATMSIDGTTLTTAITGATDDNLSINLTEVATLGDLVALISGHEAYSCLLREDSSLPSVNLDIITGVDILTAPYSAYANTQAVIDLLNQETNGELVATLASGATRESLEINASFIALAGGTDVVPTTTDWQNTFDLLTQDEYSDIDHIIVGSSDPVVHSIASAHCREMGKVKVRKERQFLTGAGSTKSLDDRISESIDLNDSNGEYVFSKIQRLNRTNNTTEWFAPYYGAAIIAGIRANNNVTMSATFKNVNVTGIESFSNPEQGRIIKSGGTYFLKTGSTFTVGHNVTTFQGNDIRFRLPSVVQTIFFIQKDLRRQGQELIAGFDRAPDAFMVSSTENRFNTVILRDYRTIGYITDNPNTGEPAFTPVSLVLDGEVFKLKTTLTIPVATHYNFITINFQTVGSVPSAA
jgi:hypothetical protein